MELRSAPEMSFRSANCEIIKHEIEDLANEWQRAGSSPLVMPAGMDARTMQ